MCWTCLSLVAIRPILENNEGVQQRARVAVNSFAWEDGTGNHEALASARKIDGNLQKARQCLIRLVRELPEEEDLTEEVKEDRLGLESEFSLAVAELVRLDVEANNIQGIDVWMSRAQSSISEISNGITPQIPGIRDPPPVHLALPFGQFVDLFCEPLKRQFICPGRALQSMCSPALTLRKILRGQWDADEYKKLLCDLRKFVASSRWEGNEMQQQLLRLQDLRDG